MSLSSEKYIYKFGGASLADAGRIKNVVSIIKSYGPARLVVVISALGKTTNELERIHMAAMAKDPALAELIRLLEEKHLAIAAELFETGEEVYKELNHWFGILRDWAFMRGGDDALFLYDQIVCIGEYLSSILVSHFLRKSGRDNSWINARDIIRTDHSYREGKVDWDITRSLIDENLDFTSARCYVVQGFIGGTVEKMATTLGREGSDYTAAIIASCIEAAETVVWKDVPGVLNADPRLFKDAVKLDEISYYEAIEMTYYGAQVIHPKTLQPLQQKKIPLRVKSFLDPDLPGTIIHSDEARIPASIPVIIFKPNQLLISVYTRDFSFIADEHISQIYAYLVSKGIKANLSQNSATNFSLIVDNVAYKTEALLEYLQHHFRVLMNEGLQILTIRNYQSSPVDLLIKDKEVLLEQKSRHTVQILLK